MGRRFLVFLADTHGGHNLGLLNPETVLLDEAEDGEIYPYIPSLSRTQEYMWGIYEEHRHTVAEIAGDDEIIVFHVGDATHGKKHIQHLVSNRWSDQILIGAANLRPWLEMPNVKTVRLAKGTGSHVFDEGSSEILIASQLQAEYPDRDIKAIYHGLANIKGTSVDVDYAHHGPGPGRREWLRGNVARFYLRDLMMREIMAGYKPPSLVVRAHYHTLVTELLDIRANGSKHTSRLAILPSYCGIGSYGRKAVRSPHKITNGMLVYAVSNGRLSDVLELVNSLDVRTKEEL